VGNAWPPSNSKTNNKGETLRMENFSPEKNVSRAVLTPQATWIS
jgi:hypothetical protein